MKILKDETAARLARLLAKGGQNGPTRAVRRSGPSAPSPRLFDLCFKPDPGSDSGEFGIWMFVGSKQSGYPFEEAVRVNGRKVECAWEWSSFDPYSPWQMLEAGHGTAPSDGTAVWIVFGVDGESWSHERWAAALNNGNYQGELTWRPVIGTLYSPPFFPDLPNGANDVRYLHPVLVGFWMNGVGLVQAHAGPVEITIVVPDTDAAGAAAYQKRMSMERHYDGTLAVRGWTNPEYVGETALTNSDGSTAADASRNALLVRSELESGASLRMRYFRFDDLLAALDKRYPSKVGYDGGGAPDPVASLYKLPCPTGTDKTKPLCFFYNPCDLVDGQGNVLQPAGWQQGQFWPVGGRAAVCKGASIGDSNGNDAIDLDGHSLSGDWFASSNLDVDGNLAVYGKSAFGNATADNLAVFGTLTLGDGARAMDVGAALSALFDRVTAVENSLSGLETLLSQI